MQECNHQAQRWRPTNREHYFIILGDGDITKLQWNDTIFDHAVWNFGNCFRVWQEAEQARDGMKEDFATFHRSMEGQGLPKWGVVCTVSLPSQTHASSLANSVRW